MLEGVFSELFAQGARQASEPVAGSAHAPNGAPDGLDARLDAELEKLD